MDNVIFPVEKIPAKELLPEYTTRPGISHAIVREDTGEILHWASANYALITNKEIVTKFSKHLTDNGYPHQVESSGYGNVRFRMNFILKARQAAIAKGDIVAASLAVDNSYNGTLRYQFGTGLMRLVCMNGLTVWERSDDALKMLHTPSADDGLAIEKSLVLVAQFLAKFDDLIEPFYELMDQPVRHLENRIDEIIEATAFPIGQREGVIQRINFEMKTLNQEASDWLIYNGFNYMLGQIDHFLGRKGDNIDRAVLDYLLNY